MKNKVILLVEDNRNDEELALRALKVNNITNEVIVARDGREALDYLFATGAHVGRNTAELPVVVLLDINLPKIDGLEVLNRLRSDVRTRMLPVVMLTSSTDEGGRLRSYMGGANSFVQKPVDFEEFSAAIKQLGLYWLLLNEGPPSRNE